MSNIKSTQEIKRAVEYARNRAKQAETEFDRANSEIQAKASRSIDLFGGHVTSSVADIARDARVACDNLFATYQSLILTVDEKCRPLLSQDPDVSAVREVKDLIEWLNNESEIENNFNASLNGRDLGDVASRRYIPSIESKMIERYWEDKYMTFPGREESEAKARSERTERIRIELEERKKAEAEQRAEYDRQIQAYEKKYAEWMAVSEQQKMLREKELSEMISREQAAFSEKLDKDFCDTKYELEEKRSNAKQALNDAKNKLANAGFFAFAAKKEAKALIEKCNQVIVDIDKSLEKAEKDYANKNKKIKKFLDEKSAELKMAADRKYPVPPAPEKPHSPVLQSAVNMVDVELEAAILASMEPGKLYTITDLVYNCSETGDLTNAKVASVVRKLVPSHIDRIEKNRKAYFRLAPSKSPTSQNSETNSAVHVVNEMIKEAILESMEIGKLYTIADIIQNCAEASDLTNQRVSALVRQMIPSDIERVEKERMAYFRRLK